MPGGGEHRMPAESVIGQVRELVGGQTRFPLAVRPGLAETEQRVSRRGQSVVAGFLSLGPERLSVPRVSWQVGVAGAAPRVPGPVDWHTANVERRGGLGHTS